MRRAKLVFPTPIGPSTAIWRYPSSVTYAALVRVAVPRMLQAIRQWRHVLECWIRGQFPEGAVIRMPARACADAAKSGYPHQIGGHHTAGCPDRVSGAHSDIRAPVRDYAQFQAGLLKVHVVAERFECALRR